MFFYFYIWQYNTLDLCLTAFRRSTGFSIYTYIPQNFSPLTDPKHLVYQHDPQSGCPKSVMNVTVNSITQGITYINKRPNGYTSSCQQDNVQYTGIEICEIRVMGLWFFVVFCCLFFYYTYIVFIFYQWYSIWGLSSEIEWRTTGPNFVGNLVRRFVEKWNINQILYCKGDTIRLIRHIQCKNKGRLGKELRYATITNITFTL